MSDVDWGEVAEIFADALEQPAERRSAFVAGRSSGRPDLRATVERLLEAEAAADRGFLEGFDPGSAVNSVGPTGEYERLGPYRLLQEIGRGGMGQVFLAERADGQFEQRVAIKLLKRGMDSDAILARFLRERQILASLSHPNIARLVDGGMADDGRPYFVMEHVDGRPITHYCDEHRLSIDDRLHLFRAVCRAVEYAHRNLVLHRDLKPSNIFVTADGVPKLLDFGIAKVLSAEGGADAETLTQSGARMLTPEYAAPEQFLGGGVTTSTDVYGLGVVLFELLLGGPPFERGRAVDLVTHRRPDAEPPRLTAALASRQNAIAAIAGARSTDPGRLRRRLAGDLETIVATALRAAPERRYGSVEAIREDVRRHQERLPVTARPDTAAYRVSRFIRRHRTGVLTTATIAILVLAFGGTASRQAGRIRLQAADLEVERDRARTEAAAADEVSRFLVGVFEVSDPLLQGAGDSIRARDLLDRGAHRIDAELRGQPELQARLLAVIGRAYHNLWLSDRAEPLLERAVELQRSVHGDESAPVVIALQQLARVQLTRGEHINAETNLRQATAINERIGDDPMMAWTLSVDLVYALHGRGDAQGGTAALDEAWSRFERVSDIDLTAERDVLRRMAELLTYRPGSDEVDRVYARLVDVEGAATGPRSAAVATAYIGWAGVREARGEFQAADSMLRIALSIQHDQDSTSVAASYPWLKLAGVWLAAREYDRADSLYRVAIPLISERVGEDHRWVANARARLADALAARGRFEEAIPLYEAAIATYRREGGTDAAVHLPVEEWRLAAALRGAGRPAESIPVFLSSIRGFDARFPPDYLLTTHVRHDLGRAFLDLDRPAEAEPALRQAITGLVKRWGEHDIRVDIARIALVRALSALARHDEAEAVLAGVRRRLEPRRGADGAVDRRVLDALEALDALDLPDRAGRQPEP